ncbi:uncharacterized protein A4U43_C08F4010 [Asparagus officinalis]|uniref:E3 ubiquitin-protein ligase XBAT33-like n=1 Tax=Asparagus officinalis TaxID=4686 RepID=UPI00098E3A0E|nr:E3 ubiquitin-protein ligase XBAT33-like [Asparagus officinalis]ONK59200.1 uncharacterized protein A4U43_C08F4010 [Asparagus officinalis]
MGNSIFCSAPGERLASAARDGDLAEAKLLLEQKSCLATYSSFAALNSPLHFAASKGHTEMVMLLLENGADVNSRNFYGQTALMQACHQGHWELVQVLLIFGADVTKAEYLGKKTALHFAAANGHIRCIRLLAADFIPSTPDASSILSISGDKGRGSNKNGGSESSAEINALSKFINKMADGRVTSVHLAALNGHSDCLQLLLDLRANVSALTYHYGSSSSIMIGAGSTPLHFAACGGDLKCCQVLLARGACRSALNFNGWHPVDVAKVWRHHFLDPLLSPYSDLKIAKFPPSSYLSLPLRSILNLARECRFRSLTASSDENDLCAVCLENACSVAAQGCEHELCVKCALYLCSTGNVTSEVAGPPGSIPCPLCRNGIVSFIKIDHTQIPEIELPEYKCLHAPQRSQFSQNCMLAVS